jgi:hypothetical protein
LINNCVKFNSPSECTQCSTDYFLESPNVCTQRTHLNCESVNLTEDSCISCKNGFLLSSQNKCEVNSATHCAQFHATHASCLSCQSNYFYDLSNGQCLLASVPFCKIYMSNTQNCLRCAQGYYLDVASNSCLKFQISHCQVFHHEKNQCLKCESGYYLDGSTCRLGTVSNCEVYFRTKDDCHKCFSKYTPFRGHCVSPTDLQNLELCAELDPGSLICNECVQGYFLAQKVSLTSKLSFECTQYSSDLNCASFNPSSDTCELCYESDSLTVERKCTAFHDVNCLLHSSVSKTCLQCKASFYFDSASQKCLRQSTSHCLTFREGTGQCSKCSSSFYLGPDLTCWTRVHVPNCTQYEETSNSCLLCNSGYFIKNNFCFPEPKGLAYCEVQSDDRCNQCSPNFILNTSGTCEYSSKNIENCSILERNEATVICSKCDEDFLLSPDKLLCQKKNISGCLTWKNTSECASCNSDSLLEKVDQTSVCKKITIPNCLKAMNEGNKSVCVQCDPHRFWNASLQSCDSVENEISKCSIYESKSSCLECQTGYLLTPEKNQCLPNSLSSLAGCSSGRLFSPANPSCLACRPGYYLGKSGSCVRCEVLNCAICNSSLKKCLVCASNFYMNSEFKCLPLFEDITEPTVVPTFVHNLSVFLFWVVFIQLLF